MKTIIKVDNLKCGGCASSITKSLKEIKGVSSVNVSPETGDVEIMHDLDLNLGVVKETLHHLGYPESGTAEGFDKLASNVKSYVSCAIGRLNPEDKEEKKN